MCPRSENKAHTPHCRFDSQKADAPPLICVCVSVCLFEETQRREPKRGHIDASTSEHSLYSATTTYTLVICRVVTCGQQKGAGILRRHVLCTPAQKFADTRSAKMNCQQCGFGASFLGIRSGRSVTIGKDSRKPLLSASNMLGYVGRVVHWCIGNFAS